VVRWRPGRLPVGAVVLYIGLMVSSVLLVAEGAVDPFDPFSREATPAFAPSGTEVPHEGKDAGTGMLGSALRSLGVEGEVFRQVLNLGLPALGVMNKPVTSDLTRSSWRDLLDGFIYLITDVRPSEPLSYLRAQMPMLALIVPAREGTMPYHVVLVPEREDGSPPSTPPSDTPGDQDGEEESPEDHAQLWLGSVEPLVMIYHSHTQESYGAETPFSRDDQNNMLRVGGELAGELKERYGVAVVHVREYFDVNPDGTGMNRVVAYANSGQKIAQLLRQYPSVQVLLDLHRDSASREQTVFRAVGGEFAAGEAARIMIVLGCDEHLRHPGWRRNREFAESLAGLMEREYPGLLWKIYQKDYRYNQHLLPGALLMEMGGVENTLDEALSSARMLARIIAMALRDGLVPSTGS